MTSSNRYEDRILKAAREHFAMHGYYGSRVDDIADEARLNKRMVYEYNHTKEGLYLSVLSRVSCDTMAMVDQKLPVDALFDDVRSIFIALFDVLEKSDSFIRLWTWEQLATTIHGVRILETVSAIFERVRKILANNAKAGRMKEVSDESFEEIKMLCYGYFISSTVYLENKQEVEIGANKKSPAFNRLNLSMELQGMVLNAIMHSIDTHIEK